MIEMKICKKENFILGLQPNFILICSINGNSVIKFG